MLMPQLKRSERASIVCVGAPVIKGAKIHFDDLSLKNDFSMISGMKQCMYAIHLMVQEFAARNKDTRVVMNMMNVGVSRTGIMRELNFFLKLMVKLFGQSPEKACANAVYLADSNEVNFCGYFLNKPGKPHIKEKEQWDAAEASRLWDLSLQLIG